MAEVYHSKVLLAQPRWCSEFGCERVASSVVRDMGSGISLGALEILCRANLSVREVTLATVVESSTVADLVA